ncbi:apoptosis-associated speck-like protein containing a CARD [Anguilla anguilla]|uniref:apoptosis-associated speck-like protein containing a CARD n=1 Tax=Anguilla anguilla TaxID=7936 RepID=UPI0015ABC187|nr:apoptosis-associated speck-like protein containing a CARD [Anguilla anguilla]
MPKSVRDRIIAVLDNLSKQQLLRFKHKLSELKIVGFGLIEKEIAVQITQRLVSKFTEARAIARTAEVLRAIDLQDEADSLEQGENDREGANVATGAGAASPTAAGENGGSATSCSPKPTEGQHFVDKNHVGLITRITEVKPILDRLYEKKLISIEMFGRITAEKTNEDRMRKLLYDVILPQGEGAKDELVAILDEQQPYIMGTLRGK